MVAQTKTAEPTVVNGINVDDLFALIEGVRRDAAKSKTNWRVTTTWQGQTRSRAQVEGFGIGGEQVPRRFAIDIDEPNELGGSNRFANPQEHLLAALNACMTVGYVAQSLASMMRALSGEDATLQANNLCRKRSASANDVGYFRRSLPVVERGLADPTDRVPFQGVSWRSGQNHRWRRSTKC